MNTKVLFVMSILVSALLFAACAPTTALEPTALPPTQLPPTDVQPTDVLPTEVPPTELAATTDATLEPTIPPLDASGVSFANDVQPILNSRCASCHGLERTSGDFDLTTYDLLMAGGEEGLAVLPGDAASSPLVTLSESGNMPKNGPKLTPDQLQVMKDWVNQGALNN